MSKERVPEKHIENPRDAEGRMTDQVKSAWRSATHSRKEITGHGEEKTRYRMVRREGSLSLKAFARRQDDDASKRWLHDKGANTANPPLGIGCTRKKKSENNSGGAVKLDGKQKR